MELQRRPRCRQRLKVRNAVVPADDARSIHVHDLSDDSLWQILLGLDCPLWLVRASCACKRWRRIITDRTFLRLARSLHAPTIVGQYHNHTVDHLFVPSSRLPAALIIDGSRFAIDDRILQKSQWTWHVDDYHGGLILLRRTFEHHQAPAAAPSLIVYDPLTRQHKAIYSPPLVEDAVDRHGIIDVFLLDGGEGDISISNFRVMYRFLAAGAGQGGPLTCVFSTNNRWGENWSFQKQPADAATGSMGQFAGRIDGCLYVGLQMGRVIALDNASLLFSKVELPISIRLDTPSSGPSGRPSTFTVVHDGAGLDGPTSHATTTTTSSVIVHVRGPELELFRRLHGGSGEWVLEHSIANLLEATRGFSGCMDKCVRVEWRTVVDAIAEDGAGFAILSARSHDKRWLFSIDVNTMEMQLLPEEPNLVLPEERYGRKIFNYTLPWPRFLRA